MNDEATAERLGLSPYDLVLLAAEECGLIPEGYDEEREQVVDESACTICRAPNSYPECDNCWYGEERRWTPRG